MAGMTVTVRLSGTLAQRLGSRRAIDLASGATGRWLTARSSTCSCRSRAASPATGTEVIDQAPIP